MEISKQIYKVINGSAGHVHNKVGRLITEGWELVGNITKSRDAGAQVVSTFPYLDLSRRHPRSASTVESDAEFMATLIKTRSDEEIECIQNKRNDFMATWDSIPERFHGCRKSDQNRFPKYPEFPDSLDVDWDMLGREYEIDYLDSHIRLADSLRARSSWFRENGDLTSFAEKVGLDLSVRGLEFVECCYILSGRYEATIALGNWREGYLAVGEKNLW